MTRTSERNLPTGQGPEDAISRDRHRFAYATAAERLESNEDVLDIGCGEGYGATILLEAANEYTGVDLSATVVDEARRNFGSTRTRFAAFDGTRIPFEDGTFDAAVSFQVIEHVADVRSYLAEARRVIKPAGWAMFTISTCIQGPGCQSQRKSGQQCWASLAGSGCQLKVTHGSKKRIGVMCRTIRRKN